MVWFGTTGNGKTSAKNPVGAKVSLSYIKNGTRQNAYRTYHLVNGFSAQGDSRMIFALGKITENVSDIRIKIIWPDGTQAEVSKVVLNAYQIIQQQ